MVEVLDTLNGVLQLVGRSHALGRDQAADAVLGAPLWTAIAIALLASLSTGIAHSSVLYLNRVGRVHATFAAILGLVFFLLLRLIEAVVTGGVAWLVTGMRLPLTTLVVLFLLAMAPQVFNVITVLPHFGLGLGKILEAWSFLVLFVLLGAAYRIPTWEAFLITTSGWLVIQLLSRLLTAPLTWLGSRIWTLASGRPVFLTSRDILAGTPFIPVEARAAEIERG